MRVKTGILKCSISKTAPREGCQNLWLSHAELRMMLVLLALRRKIKGEKREWQTQFHSRQPSNGLNACIDYLIVGNLHLLSATSICSGECRTSSQRVTTGWRSRCVRWLCEKSGQNSSTMNEAATCSFE